MQQAAKATANGASMITAKDEVTIRSSKDETMYYGMQLSPPTCTYRWNGVACEHIGTLATELGGLEALGASTLRQPLSSDIQLPVRGMFKSFHPSPSPPSEALVLTPALAPVVMCCDPVGIPDAHICAAIQEAINSALQLPPSTRDATLEEIKRIVWCSEKKEKPDNEFPEGRKPR